MKIKSLLTVAGMLIAGLSADAQIVVKQTMNVAGRVYVTTDNGLATKIARANYRDFVEIITDDMGYPLNEKELRTSKLVSFDFGFGLEGLFVEFWDGSIRQWCLLDVSDRFDYEFLSDISGNDFDLGGRWAAIIAIAIDLVDDGEVDLYAEFWGIGSFQGAVRNFRRGGADIVIPTAGLRSTSFPAILDLSVDGFEDRTPGFLTIAFRSQAVIFEDLKVINWDEL